MKNLPLILASFILVLLFACGSDTVTNQTPGSGEEVIFSMDSFAINLTSGTIAIDTSIEINVPNIKLTFDCSTNADSISSIGYLRITSIDSIASYIDTVSNTIESLNRTHKYYINGSMHFFTLLYLQLTQSSTLQTFLKLRNIRITKI